MSDKQYIAMIRSQGGGVFKVQGRRFLQVITPVWLYQRTASLKDLLFFETLLKNN